MAAALDLRTWLLAAVLASAFGCATWAPDCPECSGGCAPMRALCSAYHGELADEVVCCSRGCCAQSCPHWYEPDPCPRCGPECFPCRECMVAPFALGCERLGMWGRRCQPSPGPPPTTLQPEMPPKFLPVPTQPILSPVRPDAPDTQRGDVELGYDKQVVFPARD